MNFLSPLRPYTQYFMRNLQYFRSMFSWLFYSDITKHTYIRSEHLQRLWHRKNMVFLWFGIPYLFNVVCYLHTAQAHP